MDDQDKPRKPSITSLPTGPLARNWAITRLGVTTGAKIAAHSAFNLFRDADSRTRADRDFYLKEARKLADELGRLKGSIMKAGQMLSLHAQYFLPEEAVTVLSSLQDNTAPVDWSVIAPVLDRALGRERLRELEIDQRPLAAASLGQAHRARRKRDGLELVLKIRYPGVAEAIESDVTTLARLVSMTRLAPKGLDLAPVFAEVREMLHREVDYELERIHTEEFHKRLAHDPRFAVPRVLPEYCSDQVLTSTFESGVHVQNEAVLSLPQAERDRLGRNFIELFLTEFFDWGLVQTDPHFGNYRFRVENGRARIVLLDFGATRVFGPGFVHGYADIVGGAMEDDRDRILRGAREIGLLAPGQPVQALDGFIGLCRLIVEPFGAGDGGPLWTKDGKYKWGDSDVPVRVAGQAARAALSRHFRVPPREIVFLHRRLAGVFIMAATLDAELNTRELLQTTLARVAAGRATD